VTRTPSQRPTRATDGRHRVGGRGSRVARATGRERDALRVAEQLRQIERDGGDGILCLAEGQTLAVSNLAKVYFPESAVTKGAVMRYYARMAPAILPALAGRPLALRRFPGGIEGESFFQHDPGEHVPDAVRTHPVRVEGGGEERRLIGGDLATLLYTVQLGAIAVNAWHSRLGTIDTPDYAVLDLDPGPGVPFAAVVEVAQLARAELARHEIVAAAKTSGSRGLHLLVPLPPNTSYDAAARLAEEVASAVADARPDVATVERALAKRPAGTVYVDHMQNAHGKTLASVYSVRARPGAPVSAPLSWRQVMPTLDPARWTVATVPRQRRALAARWSAQMDAPNLRARTEFPARRR
jgi:bifunctional non-homologous end joining protein LigD